MKGRILLSSEGINGTLSCPTLKELNEYMEMMERFDLIGELGVPPSQLKLGTGKGAFDSLDVPKPGKGRLFANIDWKTSTVHHSRFNNSIMTGSSTNTNNNINNSSGKVEPEPFPDLKIQIVNEIINTGGTIHVNDIPHDSGKEISPEEFHSILVEAQKNDGEVYEVDEDEEKDVSNEGGGEDEGAAEAKGKQCNGKKRQEEPPSKESKLYNSKEGDSNSKKKMLTKKEIVLIDVRNTFEHAIGHFLHPHSHILTPNGFYSASTNGGKSEEGVYKGSNKGAVNIDDYQSMLTNIPSAAVATSVPALNPNTVTFSHFSSTFCDPYSKALQNKKVLMYCTGGIRCIKASAMLKKRGITDVSHLKGGIHRYLEKYGSGGFYKGKVFVFDQRVALDPEDLVIREKDEHSCGDDDRVVGADPESAGNKDQR